MLVEGGAAVGVSAGVQGVGVGVAEPGCWEYHGGSYTDTGSGRPFCLGAGAERRPWFTRWPVTRAPPHPSFLCRPSF